MLDRLEVLRQIEARADLLWRDRSALHLHAQQLFMQMAADATFFAAVDALPLSQQLPRWIEAFDARHVVAPLQSPYTVIAVDGSQIYPDRHYGASYYLLNIGSVVLSYETQTASVQFATEPLVCIPDDLDTQDTMSIDYINCRRHELELKRAYDLALQHKQKTGQLPFVLLDGSYIAWHLQAKDAQMQQLFLPQQLHLYHLFEQESIPLLGYISMPRSKELVNLLDWYAQTRTTQTEAFDARPLFDTTIASFFLASHTRTGMFANNAPISLHYPMQLRPWFCYLDVGSEIVRLELPQWLMQNSDACRQAIACALDQACKGNGFPVCLAEAHEQAVVKGPDREFFYQMVERVGLKLGRNMIVSQKSSKKRGIAI